MQIGDFQSHPISLHFFDSELETEFREDHFRKTISHSRIALLVGIFLYSIFGILDRFIIPSVAQWAWFIRFGVVVPCMLVIYILSFTSIFRRFVQSALAFGVTLAGAGIIVMISFAAAPGTYLYYSGLILVVIYAYTIVRLRFPYAAIASWLLLVSYEAAALLIRPIALSFFVNNSFFLISANLIGMVSCYQTELSLRRDFLQRKELRALEQRKRLMEKERILKDLHDGVGGMATSIAMLADMAQKEYSLSEIKKTLHGISELACESVTEIRNFLQSLDTRELTWQALASELRYRGSNLLSPCGITFTQHTEIEDGLSSPGSLASLAIFRIYREALTNVLKHSRAKSVTLQIKIGYDAGCIILQDDGTGLPLGEVGRGRGLRHMRLRAAEIGGALAVKNDGGTSIKLTFPLAEKYLASGMDDAHSI